MTLKFTMQFNTPGWSWSEAHYYSVQNLGPGDAAAIQAAQSLAAARVNMLGTGAVLQRVRISEVPANREVVTVVPPFIPSNGALGFITILGNKVGSPAVLPGAVLCVKLAAGALGTTRIFLGGIPGIILTQPGVGNLGYDLSLSPSFAAALGAFMTFLTLPSSAWGWMSRAGTEEPPIVPASQGLVTNAQYPGAVGIVTQDNRIGVLNPGSQVDVRGWRRLSLRSPGLSGTYRTLGPTLVATGPPQTWTYFLANTGQVQPSNFYTTGSLSPHVPQFLPYLSWSIIGATTRKRGARSGAHRGRSSIRV